MIEITYDTQWSSKNIKVYNYNNPDNSSVDVIKPFIFQKLSFDGINKKINIHVERGYIFFECLNNPNDQEKIHIFNVIDRMIKGTHLITQPVEIPLAPLSAFSPFESIRRKSEISNISAPCIHPFSERYVGQESAPGLQLLLDSAQELGKPSSKRTRTSSDISLDTTHSIYAELYKELLKAPWKNNRKELAYNTEQLADRYPLKRASFIYKNMNGVIYQRLRKYGLDYKANVVMGLFDNGGDCLYVFTESKKFQVIVDLELAKIVCDKEQIRKYSQDLEQLGGDSLDSLFSQKQVDISDESALSSQNPVSNEEAVNDQKTSKTISTLEKNRKTSVKKSKISHFFTPLENSNDKSESLTPNNTSGPEKNNYREVYQKLLNLEWDKDNLKLISSSELVSLYPDSSRNKIFLSLSRSITRGITEYDRSWRLNIRLGAKVGETTPFFIVAHTKKHRLLVDLRLAILASDSVAESKCFRELNELNRNDPLLKENIQPADDSSQSITMKL